MQKIPRAVYIQAIIDEAERFNKPRKLIADIKVPRDNWEWHFAFMEYNRVGLQQLFGKRIEVVCY